MTEHQRSPLARGCVILAGLAIAAFVGTTVAGCAGAFAAGRAINAGPVALPEVNRDWTIEGREDLDPPAVASDLMMSCGPMRNGIAVLFHHAWYNTMTSGYDQRLWINGPAGSYDSVGLYVWSNTVFVRDETSRHGYNNQVLVCDDTVRF